MRVFNPNSGHTRVCVCVCFCVCASETHTQLKAHMTAAKVGEKEKRQEKPLPSREAAAKQTTRKARKTRDNELQRHKATTTAIAADLRHGV